MRCKIIDCNEKTKPQYGVYDLCLNCFKQVPSDMNSQEFVEMCNEGKQRDKGKDEDISKLQTNYEMLKGDYEGLREFCLTLLERIKALEGKGLAR